MTSYHRVSMIAPLLPSQPGREHAVLYLRRSTEDDLEPGKWGVPGGHIDKGESPTRAAIRELKEETGIERKATQLFPLHAFVHTFVESKSQKPMAAEQHIFYTVLPPDFTTDSVVLISDHIDKRFDGLPKLRKIASSPEQHQDEYTGPDIALITKCLPRLEERINSRAGQEHKIKVRKVPAPARRKVT